MIERIIDFSIKHKPLVGLGVLLLIAFGVRAAILLPVDAVPDITNNQVQVITIAPTLATVEVEQFVSYPVEQVLSNMPNMTEMRSISRFGVSQVTLVFEDDMDPYLARQLVNERLQMVRSNMPDGVEQPYLAPLSTGLGEVYQYVLHTAPGFEDRYSPMELREIQDWIIARRLTGIPGVAEINSFGGYLKQYEVSVDPLRLQGMGIGLDELLLALERNNANTGGAYIERNDQAYYIRGLGLAESLEDIGQIVVRTPEHGAPLLVRDVAKVQLGHAPRYGAMTRNGEGEVVGGIVMMLRGHNASEVVAAVKERMIEVERSLPEGLVVDPFLDRADLVSRAISTVETNLIEGALIVILVLVLFLGQLRAGLIVASVIPLAMLFALILMNLFGVSGNLMSLGAIDFGLIVDGAVIIVEAVLHRMQGIPAANERLTRDRMDQEVSGAAGRMMSAAAFGQLIILIVYIPILTLRGIEGKMFGPMAQTVSFAILGAIILGLTYVPMMSALFISRRTGPSNTLSDRAMAALERGYRPILNFALARKVSVLVGALALFVLSIFGFTRMGGEFIPQLEEGDFAFHSILPPGASLSASVRNNTLVEKKLLSYPEVKMVVGKAGTAEVPTDLMSPEQTDVMIMLNEKHTWTTTKNYWDLADTLYNALHSIPGVFFEINQPIQMRFNELMTGVRQDVAIKIYGPDLDTLVHYAGQIASLVQDIPGAGTPQVEQVEGLPQIAVRYDRERLAALGYDVAGLNRSLRAAFAGEAAGAINENERRFDLVVRADEGFRKSIDDVAALYVRNDRGDQVPLGQLADVKFEAAPAQITHENAQRRIYVGVNARGRDVESLVREIEQRVDAEVVLPAGYYLTYGGQFQNLVEAKQRLTVVVPMALLLILVLLYFSFRSVPLALLIFSTVPMSAIGGVAALYLRDMPFSISAGVGFIALFGVAVLNGLVMISTFQHLAEEGEMDILVRIRKATKMRLRPVLMTASVASLGFLPMALSSGSGAEVQRPLATVVIGGLITATLLTLVVLPVLYAMFFKGRKVVATVVPALLLLFVFSAGDASAQELRQLSLDSVLSMAQRTSPSLQAVRATEAGSQQLRRTAFDLPRTEFQYMQGQFNSYERQDNNITIQQRLPFPTAVAARSGLVKAEAESATVKRRVSEADLRYEIAGMYHHLQYLHAMEALVSEEDSTYQELARVADARHSAGEGSFLQSTTAAVRMGEVQEKHRRLLAEIALAQERLALRSGYDTPVDVLRTPLEALVVPGTPADPLRGNLDLLRFDQELQVAHQRKRVESNAMLPDLMLGYFNQSLIGTPTNAENMKLADRGDRFEGFLAGVSMPLWFVPQAARAKAAGYQEEAARNTLEDARLRSRSEIQAVLSRLQQDETTMKRYTDEALPNAERILSTSNTAFVAGDIGQAEHVLNVQQAIEIRQAYLRVLFEHNANVLLLQRLIPMP